MKSLRRWPKLLLVVLACLVAVSTTSLVTVLLGREQALNAENARKDAAVRRATAVVALAIKADLPSLKARLYKASLPPNENGYYRWFVAVTSHELGRVGADFKWEGKTYRWPTNPFSGRPVKAGTGPGDFSCRFTWWGNVQGFPNRITITGYGHDGKPVVTLAASLSSAPYPIVPRGVPHPRGVPRFL